jgi:protein SFI1
MPEFDDEPLVPDPDDPAFMSTPTKWTGSTRVLAYRPTTSTPSAILPSPYERELRRQYAGGGGLKSRVVEFADINEESAEELYR